MSDEQDPPSPGDGEESTTQRADRIRAQRIANLKPITPGEVRNPKGINGRAQREAFVSWAEDMSPDDKDGKTRIQAVDEAIFRKALRGSAQAQKLFVEQYRGRARQHIELTADAGNGPPVTFLIPENGRDVPPDDSDGEAPADDQQAKE